MSKRLQVLLDPKEFKLFAKMAEANGMSLGEWVRQSLRKSVREASASDPQEKLRAIHAIANKSAFPTGDIDELLADIEKGRFES